MGMQSETGRVRGCGRVAAIAMSFGMAIAFHLPLALAETVSISGGLGAALKEAENQGARNERCTQRVANLEERLAVLLAESPRNREAIADTRARLETNINCGDRSALRVASRCCLSTL